MFSTDFIFRQQENLVENKKCHAGFRPLCPLCNIILLSNYHISGYSFCGNYLLFFECGKCENFNIVFKFLATVSFLKIVPGPKKLE
jgi:hypothetical protein